MGPHAANELVTTKPARPASYRMKNGDRSPIDRNRDLLTGGYPIE